ncbi:hypothetical protein N665_2609s0005 [Sinapis alba]|nr:hypothetical protein N665_2609s0005 [Sinapis alba]
MKIFVKTLKGARFEIQVNPEESVADVKKNIEIMLGVTAAYPATEQVLIHKGNVLKDETTVEANNVSEKSIICVMKVHAAHPSSAATETPGLSRLIPVTPTEPASDAAAAASNMNYESVSESNIQQILEMVRGAWSREIVTGALCLAHNDVDKALEYLYFDLPVLIEDPYITEDQTQEPVAPEKEAEQRRSLDSLRHTPAFEYLRVLVQSDPSILKESLEVIEKHNQPLVQLIRDNKAYFLRLLLEQTQEPNNGGDSGNQVVGESEETEVDEQPQAEENNKPNNGGGDGGNQVGESEETEVEVATPED